MSLVRYSDELFLVSSDLLCCGLVYLVFFGRDGCYCGIIAAAGRVVSMSGMWNIRNVFSTVWHDTFSAEKVIQSVP
jgi:hypothetical protein